MSAIAIDLDGCLAQCDTWVNKHHIGDPYPGAVEAVAAMVAAGYRVIIHTCRTLEADGSPFDDGSTSEEAAATIQAWLATHGFPAGIEVWTGRGKPYADAYIDDKAVRVAPGDGIDWCWAMDWKKPQNHGVLPWSTVTGLYNGIIRKCPARCLGVDVSERQDLGVCSVTVPPGCGEVMVYSGVPGRLKLIGRVVGTEFIPEPVPPT